MHIFYSALDVLTSMLCEHVHTVQKLKLIVIQADRTHGVAKDETPIHEYKKIESKLNPILTIHCVFILWCFMT